MIPDEDRRCHVPWPVLLAGQPGFADRCIICADCAGCAPVGKSRACNEPMRVLGICSLCEPSGSARDQMQECSIMPEVAMPRTMLTQPTARQAQQAVQHAMSVWQRTLPIWACDCLRLQARGLRNPRWTPLNSPELWDVDDAEVPTAA